jgi:hypothetical protein
MSEVTTIGLDLAKHVFQVYGIDANGAVVLRKRLRRGQVVAFFASLPGCVVGLEVVSSGQRSRSSDEASMRGTLTAAPLLWPASASAGLLF